MTTTIQQTTDLVAPVHVVTISAKIRFTVWWKTKGLIKSCQTKLNYYKKTLLPNCPETEHEKYKQYRNKCNILKGQACVQFYNGKCIDHKNNTCKLWEIINSITGKLNDKQVVLII